MRKLPAEPKTKIALIEDDELFAEKIRHDLDRKGIEAHVLTGLASAMDYLGKNVVHAVVTDVFIEGDEPDGLLLVEKCKELGVPAVLITSAPDLHIAKQGMNSGAEYLLEKPFESGDLVHAILEVLENPRGLIGRGERSSDQTRSTEKEKEFARLMLKGLSNKEIAEVLDTTVATVKFYSNQIFEKCEVGGRGELFNAVFPT